MKLFEAIMDANHRALAGDKEAGVRPDDFPNELPLAALTCIDARLNSFFPGVLGLPKEEFIWLRNAGNIITGPLSSTMRSLALACAVKGAREIAIVGHTDCLVGKTTTAKLTDAFRALGVERTGLPDNLTDFFGLFASERQNVGKAVDFVRQSPLIGPKIPVHGLMVDIATGKLDWVVNGYQALEMTAPPKTSVHAQPDDSHDLLKHFASFNIGEMKFPEMKIGEAASPAVTPANPTTTVPPPAVQARPVAAPPRTPTAPPPLRYPPPAAPRIPVPPRIRGR
jgi:carbonic anhydrase